MANEDRVEFNFVFNNKVTGQTQVQKLVTTHAELGDVFALATTKLGGLNNAMRRAINEAVHLAQANKNLNQFTISGIGGPGSSKFPPKATVGGTTVSSGVLRAQYEKEWQQAFIMDKRFNERRAQLQKAEASRKTRGIYSTAGFGGMLIAHQIGRMFDNLSVMGAIAPQIQKISQGIGSLFGDTLGKVFGDVGKAIGDSLETAFGSVLTVISGITKAISSFFSGFFLSLIGFGVTGPIGILIGIIVGAMNSIVSIVTSGLELLFNIVKGIINVITSLISAAFTIMKGIFDIGIGAISALWKGFWEGAKEVAQATWEFVKSVTQEGLDQLKVGFTELVESERLAAKAYVQVTDTAANGNKSFIAGVYGVREEMNKLRTTFGVDMASSADVLYKMLSGGFRDVADAASVANAAMQLNLVTQGSAAVSADTLRGAIQSWGASASEASSYAAQLSAAIKIGAYNADAYGTALANVSGYAAKAGMSLQEVNAIVTSVSLKGLPIARITTGLRRIIEDMQRAWKSKTAGKTISGMGFDPEVFASGKVSMEDILKIASKMSQKDLFSVFKTAQARTVMQFLMNDVEGVRKKYGELTSASAEFGKDIENMRGMFFNMFAVIKQIGMVIRENLVTPFANVLRPIITSITSHIQTAFKGIDFKKTFEGLANALNPLFIGLGGVVNLLIDGLGSFLKSGALNDFFKSEGLATVVSSVTKLLNIVVNLPEALDLAFGISKMLSGSFDTIGKTVLNIMRWISDPEVWASMIIGLQKGVETIKFMWEIMKQMFGNSEIFTAVFDIMANYLKNVFVGIGEFLATTLSAAFEIAIDFFDAMGGVKLRKFVAGLEVDILDMIMRVAEYLQLAFTSAFEQSVKFIATGPLAYLFEKLFGKTPILPDFNFRRDVYNPKKLGYEQKYGGTKDMQAKKEEALMKAARERFSAGIANFPELLKASWDKLTGNLALDTTIMKGLIGGINLGPAQDTYEKNMKNLNSQDYFKQMVDILSKQYGALLNISNNTSSAVVGDSAGGGGVSGKSKSRFFYRFGGTGDVDYDEQKRIVREVLNWTPNARLVGTNRSSVYGRNQYKFEIPSEITDPMRKVNAVTQESAKKENQTGMAVQQMPELVDTSKKMLDTLGEIRNDNKRKVRGMIVRRDRHMSSVLGAGIDEDEEGAWDGN